MFLGFIAICVGVVIESEIALGLGAIALVLPAVLNK